MKNNRTITALVLLNLALIAPTVLAKDPPATAEQLRSAVESALKAKDTNALSALFQWDGVSERMKTMMAGMFPFMVKDETTGVKLLPLPPKFQPTNEVNGVRYRPSIAVLGMLSVEHTRKGNIMSMPYGKKGGSFYLSATIEEKTAAPATPAVPLAVMVMGTLSPDSPVTGSYVYLINGKEVTEEISGKGNQSKSFWGEHIKSCTVHKISGPGGIKLIIREGVKNIFESKEVETLEPVTYQRKP